MDDQQTYLLNGLLTRNFDLGRIARFRNVPRGRQAQTYELLTSEQHEYTIYLYPPAFPPDQLAFVAHAINLLDAQRFSVVPILLNKSGSLVSEGPQGASMLVSLTTTGSAHPADQFTHHDISQVGLRLGWLHRLFNEHLPAPTDVPTIAARLQSELENPEALRHLPALPSDARATLFSLLDLKPPTGWAHGDIQTHAFLLDADHQIRTLVDFALLHYGSPHEDLIDALLALCLDQSGALIPDRGKALLESYDSLSPLKGLAWTPIVAHWCAQRLLDAARARRKLPSGFAKLLAAPERLATALASCV